MDTSEYHRNLLSRLNEAEARIGHENDSPLLDVEALAFAKRQERELRAGAAIPANVLRAILPAHGGPLAPPDLERRARFERHLVEIVEAAVLDRDRIVRDPAAPDSPHDAREALSALACGACRGSCCGAGGDHAYLTEETMLRALDAHPSWTLGQIVSSYLGYIPVETVRDSCIFHGPQGCGIPREMRSPTCNTYHCAKLTDLRSRLPRENPPPVLAVMFDRDRWTRTALLDGSGIKVLEEEPCQSSQEGQAR